MVTLKYGVKADIPIKRKANLQRIIDEFAASDATTVEFKFTLGEDYVSASVARSTLAIAVVRSEHRNIIVRKRGDRIFMLKEK